VAEFELSGAATFLDRHCIRLTPDVPFQSGTAWYPRPIDLAQPFQMSLSMVLGSKNLDGADGIAFVFHPAMRTGRRGEGMGFDGLVPAVGVEFDTYQNLHLDDPASDHLAIVANGLTRYSASAPVPLPELEDGKRHPLEIGWHPVKGLVIRLDGIVRATAPPELVTGVFDGTQPVFWGMTAATGRLSNPQDVCIESLKLSGVSGPSGDAVLLP
jgi:hypothetical protein